MELKRDYKKRDQLIFGRELDWKNLDPRGGIEHFKYLSLETLEKLKELEELDPDDYQNYCPTIEEIMVFMVKHPNFTAHGYVVSPERKDYRVSIEGVEYKGEYDKETLRNFINLFRYADDLKMEDEYLYCWHD